MGFEARYRDEDRQQESLVNSGITRFPLSNPDIGWECKTRDAQQNRTSGPSSLALCRNSNWTFNISAWLLHGSPFPSHCTSFCNHWIRDVGGLVLLMSVYRPADHEFVFSLSQPAGTSCLHPHCRKKVQEFTVRSVKEHLLFNQSASCFIKFKDSVNNSSAFSLPPPDSVTLILPGQNEGSQTFVVSFWKPITSSPGSSSLLLSCITSNSAKSFLRHRPRTAHTALEAWHIPT